MTPTINAYGQPIGPAVHDWAPRPRPAPTVIEGQYCRLEPVNPALHAADLFAAYSTATDGRVWTYLSSEPFARLEDFTAYLERAAASADPLHFTVIDMATQRAVGTMALMRIDPANGSVEVGFITYSPVLQRTRASTEAQYLLMRHAFDTLGYRRFEWKCDSLNAPSRRAAERFGFSLEGVFRQAVVYKGRSRDTAWFSVIDAEWPRVKAAFIGWLSPDNFDPQGQQYHALADLRQ